MECAGVAGGSVRQSPLQCREIRGIEMRMARLHNGR